MDSSAGHTEQDPDYVLLERQLLQVPHSTEKQLGKWMHTHFASQLLGKKSFYAVHLLCGADRWETSATSDSVLSLYQRHERKLLPLIRSLLAKEIANTGILTSPWAAFLFSLCYPLHLNLPLEVVVAADSDPFIIFPDNNEQENKAIVIISFLFLSFQNAIFCVIASAF